MGLGLMVKQNTPGAVYSRWAYSSCHPFWISF